MFQLLATTHKKIYNYFMNKKTLVIIGAIIILALGMMIAATALRNTSPNANTNDIQNSGRTSPF